MGPTPCRARSGCDAGHAASPRRRSWSRTVGTLRRPGKKTPLSNDAPSGVLSNALAVPQAFTAEDTTLEFTELRGRTGFAKSTLHRVLRDLVAARLLDRVQERSRLSGLVFELGMRASVERGLLVPTARGGGGRVLRRRRPHDPRRGRQAWADRRPGGHDRRRGAGTRAGELTSRMEQGREGEASRPCSMYPRTPLRCRSWSRRTALGPPSVLGRPSRNPRPNPCRHAPAGAVGQPARLLPAGRGGGPDPVRHRRADRPRPGRGGPRGGARLRHGTPPAEDHRTHARGLRPRRQALPAVPATGGGAAMGGAGSKPPRDVPDGVSGRRTCLEPRRPVLRGLLDPQHGVLVQRRQGVQREPADLK